MLNSAGGPGAPAAIQGPKHAAAMYTQLATANGLLTRLQEVVSDIRQSGVVGQRTVKTASCIGRRLASKQHRALYRVRQNNRARQVVSNENFNKRKKTTVVEDCCQPIFSDTVQLKNTQFTCLKIVRSLTCSSFFGIMVFNQSFLGFGRLVW